MAAIEGTMTTENVIVMDEGEAIGAVAEEALADGKTEAAVDGWLADIGYVRLDVVATDLPEEAFVYGAAEFDVEIDRTAGAIATIRSALAGYTFRVRDEAELQEQVAAALAAQAPAVWIDREVAVPGGRLDILAHVDGVGVALELKLRASAAAVERQAQRYARVSEVDAVLVVTTSARLARELSDYPYGTLGGKPFGVIELRSS